MLFNSLEYLIFFPTVVVLYYLLPHRLRWILLLLASIYFYAAWNATYLILIAFSICVDYVSAIQMSRSQTQGRRRTFLTLSLLSNLGLLVTFKYANFFIDNIASLFHILGLKYVVPHLDVLLPMGISFYTFQTLSYTIDVYHGKIKPERHLGIFSLYVVFFPQLVAGPIERAVNLLPRLKEVQQFNYDHIRSGLWQIAWGLFKKVVIADRLAVMVDYVYSQPEQFFGIPLIIATVFFAFQIFCDFSGYSDIAIGSARVLGIDLMKNFNRPYLARSIGEFWKRWHISLSTWFRDYVYIPLGGNRVGVPRWYRNLMITFIVSGFWHGANWTFLIWGALHGAFLVAETRLIGRQRGQAESLKDVLRISLTFGLVCLAWIFFRADNLQDATHILTHLSNGLGESMRLIIQEVDPNVPGSRFHFLYLGQDKYEFFLAWGLIFGLMGIQLAEERGVKWEVWFEQKPAIFRWATYFVVVLCLLFLGIFNQSQFIYFQF